MAAEGRRLPTPGASVLALADELQRRGLRRVYARACDQLGVLSVATGLTVWSDGRTLWWEHDGQHVTWPATDTTGAATWLVSRAPRAATHPPGQGRREEMIVHAHRRTDVHATGQRAEPGTP